MNIYFFWNKESLVYAVFVFFIYILVYMLRNLEIFFKMNFTSLIVHFISLNRYVKKFLNLETKQQNFFALLVKFSQKNT